MLTPGMRNLLIHARLKVRNGEYWSVHAAILSTGFSLPESFYERNYLLDYIRKALYPHPNLEVWQKRNGFPDGTRLQLQQDRLAWIDWMLDEQ